MVGYDAEKSVTLTNSCVSGVLGGINTRILISPIDVVKIRFQLQPETNYSQLKYKKIHQAVGVIFKEEGVQAFWKGHVPAQCLSMIYGGCQFFLFQFLTTKAHKIYPYTNKDYALKSATNLVCGGLAGLFATGMSHPVDVLRTRFAAQREPKIYTSLNGAISTIYKHEGLYGFYRGVTPSAAQISLYTGLQFMFYYVFKECWKIMKLKDGEIGNFVCGACTGIVSKTAIYPLDVIKKRLQVQGFQGSISKVIEYNGFRHCLTSVYKQEGIKGLYKGYTPAMLKAGMTSGFVFLTYEFYSKLLSSVI